MFAEVAGCFIQLDRRLHHLSRGVRAFQSYALEFGEGDPDKTLNYLRPNGKNLKQVFAEQLELLRRKVGADTELRSSAQV